MQLHGAFEIISSHMLERTNFNNSGVINQNVDLAEAIHDLANRRLNLFGIEQIALDGERNTAAANEIRFGAREFVSVASNQRHVAAVAANLSRKHQTEPAVTAGNECDLVRDRN